MLAGVKPWAMKKEELLAKLRELGLRVSDKETVPELRSLLIEQLPDKVKVVGLSKMTVDQLKGKCAAEGIDVPAKVTKGWMLRQLRQQVFEDTEVVTFGMYEGHMYGEVPQDYMEWALKEVTAKGDSSSPELVRMANWWRKARARVREVRKTTSYPDPEASAVIPPPAKAYARARAPTSSTTPARTSQVLSYRARASTRAAQDMDETDFSMVSTEESPEEQIKALEERIEILKTQTAGRRS